MGNEDYTYIDNINDRPLMECGHLAIYQKKFNNSGVIVEVPVCIKCSCYKVEQNKINFKKRIARCNLCGKEVKSNLNLSGFHYLKNKDHDIFYCGCANEKFLELMTVAKTD